MKFVREKGSKKENFLENLLHTVLRSEVTKEGLLVEFKLEVDPGRRREWGRGHILKVDPKTGNFELLSPKEDHIWTRTYLIKPGDLIIERMNTRSMMHPSPGNKAYTLYTFTEDGKPIKIAWVKVVDNVPRFSNETLKNIYMSMPPAREEFVTRKALQALLTYCKTQLPKEMEKLKVSESL